MLCGLAKKADWRHIWRHNGIPVNKSTISQMGFSDKLFMILTRSSLNNRCALVQNYRGTELVGIFMFTLPLDHKR